MSLYSYNQSLKIGKEEFGFECLIMAALRRADSINAEKLRIIFPEICNEMQERYNARGGILPTDMEYKA